MEEVIKITQSILRVLNELYSTNIYFYTFMTSIITLCIRDFFEFVYKKIVFLHNKKVNNKND